LQLKASLNRSQLLKIGKAPDKSVFLSLNPAKSEQRKMSLELYLLKLLDVVSDSRDVITFFTSHITMQSEQSQHHDSGMEHSVDEQASLTYVKEGILVKKGKSFGGWKSRYFRCKPDVLEYYERVNIVSIHFTI
jgi:hypothetical protein